MRSKTALVKIERLVLRFLMPVSGQIGVCARKGLRTELSARIGRGAERFTAANHNLVVKLRRNLVSTVKQNTPVIGQTGALVILMSKKELGVSLGLVVKLRRDYVGLVITAPGQNGVLVIMERRKGPLAQVLGRLDAR